MEINYELTREDYIQFNLYHIENSPSQNRLFTFMRLGLPVIFAIPVYFLGTQSFTQPSIYWIIIAVLFTAGWFLYYPTEYKKSIRKQTEKLLNEGDNSSLFGKKTLRIGDGNMTIYDTQSTETLLLNTIQSVKVYDEMILLYVSSVSAHIIPTRYIDGETKKLLLSFLNVL